MKLSAVVLGLFILRVYPDFTGLRYHLNLTFNDIFFIIVLLIIILIREMISISRNFKILIIDDNETDLKVVQRLISKDYKSIDVTARSGVTDWKIFLEGSKFDLILLNYAAGTSVGLQEIKKIIAVNDTIPIYLMIWQHEVEVGMKAIYQGAEGFVIKDKTYLNLKKIIQRSLMNYMIYSEMSVIREINDIISEKVNDGFFRFSKEGDLEYISDKFISQIGYESEMDSSMLFADLFKEIKEQSKKADDFDKEISFNFKITGKDNDLFWFEVFAYRKIDLRNDTLYYEGIFKNVSGLRNQEELIRNLKEEKELLVNGSPLPIEIYKKDGKKISSNQAFSRLMASIDIDGKDPIAKTPEYPAIKENILKAAQVNSLAINGQKITFSDKEKFFDISYLTSKANHETLFAYYNDISENVEYQNIIADMINKQETLFNTASTGFLEIGADGVILKHSVRAPEILGNERGNFSGLNFVDVFNDTDKPAVQSAMDECRSKGSVSLITGKNIKLYLRRVHGSKPEKQGFIAGVEDVNKTITLENDLKSGKEKLELFSAIKNSFIWTGTINAGKLIPEFIGGDFENITGYGIGEALTETSTASEEIFGINESNKKEFVKLLKDLPVKSITLRNRKGIVKKLKADITIQKEGKDFYRLWAMFEDVTAHTALSISNEGIYRALDMLSNSSESSLFKLDSNLNIVDVIYSRISLFTEVKPGNEFPDLQGFKDFSPKEALKRVMAEKTSFETSFTVNNEIEEKFRMIIVPQSGLLDEMFLYLFFENETKDKNLKKDYEYLTKIISGLSDSATQLMFVMENESIVYTNRGFEAASGYGKEEILSKNIREFFVNQGCFDEFQKQLKLLKKKNSIEVCLKLKDKNSVIRYCRLNCSLIQTGDAERILLIGSDETEKEALRNDIRYSEALRAAVSAMDDNALLGWKDNDLIFSNNEAETLFGYTKKELEKINIEELFSPSQDENIPDGKSHAWESSDEKTFEIICKRKHGQEFFAEASIKHVKLLDDDTKFLTVKDITEKKNLKKAIFNLDNRFRGVIDALNEGIWLFDGDYKTVFISPTLLNSLNYSIDEIHEKRIFYFIKDSGFEFDKRFFEEEYNAHYSNLCLSFIKKDNDLFNSSVNIIPLRDEKGVFIGGILAATDNLPVISRDADIKELKDINIDLEKKIKNLKNDLQQSKKLIMDYKKESENLILELEGNINASKSINDELKHKNDYIAKIYSVLQGNLKQRMLNIIGFSDFLTSVWEKIGKEQQKSYISILRNSINGSKSVFDKLMLYAKIESEQFVPDKGIINISSCVGSAADSCKEKISAKSIIADIHITPDLVINGDNKMITFAVAELIANAVEHTPEAMALKISLQQAHDKAVLTIHDSGKGMSKENIKNLIEFGKPGIEPNLLNGDHAGLSLIIIKNILDKHNASFEISQEEGLKINIIFPLTSNNFYIISNAGDNEILKLHLKKMNIETHGFDDTMVAYDAIETTGAPAGIIAAFSQPESKLYLFIEKLSHLPKMNLVPIIVMTSDESKEAKKALTDHGITNFIQLPLDEKNISAAVSAVIYK